MRRGLTQYGDAGVSLFLRKAFIRGAGCSDSALERPVIGIANTGSAYNPCHGNATQLIEAAERAQADQGVDFDVLMPLQRGQRIPRPV